MAQTHSLQLASASSQFASITDASQTGLDLTTAFTIEAWLNPTSLPASGNIVGLVTKDTAGASNRSYSLDIYNNAGTYQLRAFAFASPGTATNFSWSYVNINSYIATGTPIFIAVTFNGANPSTSRFEFFINGLSLGNGTYANVGAGCTSIYNSTAQFIVGNYDYGPGLYYNGLIKDVRVFNDVRTATEIASDAHTQNVSDANLQGEWNFNNAYTDSSGNGNTLTGNNTPTFSTTIPWENAAQVSGSTYLTTNLAAYYELEETTGTRVDSHASYDLTDNNSVGSDTGIQGTAADFGTANTNKTLTNSSLYQTGNFAISLWFRNNTEVSSGYSAPGLMAMSDNTSVRRNILLNYFYNGGSPIINADYHKNNVSDNNITWACGYLGTSAWTHLVVTYDGTYFYFYANGVLRGTLAISGGGSGSVGNQGFNLGLTARYGGSYASVDIDEVPVYSRHLHYGDVLDLFNAGAGIPYAITSVEINTNDSVSITESNTVTNTECYSSVQDNISVTELVSIGSVLVISSDDTVAITDTASVSNASLGGVDVFDSVSIAENYALEMESNISVNDSITISEFLGYYEDTIFVSENISVAVALGDINLSLNDSVTITENVLSELNNLISVNDSQSISEDVAISNSSLGNISVFDAASINENIGITNEYTISSSETVTITESTIIQNTNLGGINVNDSLSISELVSIGSNLFISTDSPVTITESITAQNTQLGDISVYDAKNVSENITVENTALGNISINDNIGITESVIPELNSLLSVYENISINENIESVASLADISVSDAQSIVDAVFTTLVHTLSVSEQISITENINVVNSNLGAISTSDSVSITELISIGSALFISSSDMVTTTDNVTINNTQLGNINAVDDISITDVVAIANTNLGGINIYDAETLSESVTSYIESYISVNDTIAVSENVDSVATIADIIVSELLSISESVAIEQFNNVTVSDSISNTELISVDNANLGAISVNESVTVTDLPSIGASLVISVAENIANTELLVIENTNLGNIISYDSISVTDVNTVNNSELGLISVYDVLTLSESTQFEVTSSIFVNTQVTITEDINTEASVGGINVSDSISISENINSLFVTDINVSDDLVISENVEVSNISLGNINVNDQITITETISAGRGISIFIYDSLSQNESVTITNTQLGDIDVNDNVIISETNYFAFSLGINTFDDLVIGEYVNTENNLSPNVYDGVSITENIVSTLESIISVYDSITVTDTASPEGVGMGINVHDDIANSESISDTGESNTSVYDSITITDVPTVLPDIPYSISVYDTISVSESISHTLSITQNPRIYKKKSAVYTNTNAYKKKNVYSSGSRVYKKKPDIYSEYAGELLYQTYFEFEDGNTFQFQDGDGFIFN